MSQEYGLNVTWADRHRNVPDGGGIDDPRGVRGQKGSSAGMMAGMIFDGFALDWVDVGPVRPQVRHGGLGPPVVLLHGHPRTHATWHRVAPLLVAAGHTVVCPRPARVRDVVQTGHARGRWPSS